MNQNYAIQNHRFDAYSIFKMIGGTIIVFLSAFLITILVASTCITVSNSDAAEIRVEADATHYTTISIPENVSISTSSSSATEALFVQSEQITTKTNSPTGYQLYLSMDSSSTTNRLYRSGDTSSEYFLEATSGSIDNPSALALNTWGFALGKGNVGVPDYDFDQAGVYTATAPSTQAKFANVPRRDKEVMIQSTSSANTTGQSLEVYYGALISDSLISGTYSGTVNYTVVADATDTTTISPSSQNTLAAGTEITITTPLYTNMPDLGTVTATVGGVTCTDLITSTATGVLVVKCKTPAKTTIGEYDVVISVPKFNKSYTVKYKYEKMYTLTYNANSGTGAPDAQTCTTDTSAGSCDNIISATAPTRAASGFSYVFAGWSTSSSATTPTYSAGSNITLTSDVTLYAVWYKSFTLSFAAGSGTAGATASQTCATTSSTATSCNITIASTTSPSRANMTFYGWSTGNNTTRSYVSGSAIALSANTTLYAIWSVTVSYNANGGSGAPSAQTCYIAYTGTGCSMTTSSATPSRTNYTFSGWGTSSSATSATYAAGTAYTMSANRTIYAIWRVTTCSYSAGQVWNYGYTGGQQSLSVPAGCAGVYKLEVWGAQGGSSSSTYRGGYGGYSYGNYSASAGTVLYVNVGGAGSGDGSHTARSGGYNGGGTARSDGDGNTRQASGGGATHIATRSGVLSSLSSYVSNILIVAGGGAGGAGNAAVMWLVGGNGGGYIGGNGGNYVEGSRSTITYGATQTAGGTYGGTSGFGGTSNGSFGQGAGSIYCGGGGGFYGGSAAHSSGSGGSGYIGNSALTSKAMYGYNVSASSAESTRTYSTTAVSSSPVANYAKAGSGYARITLVSIY